MELRRQALEDERRRREQLERRLQDETTRRQKLVEKEVKLREKHFSQVWGSGPQLPALLGCWSPSPQAGGCQFGLGGAGGCAALAVVLIQQGLQSSVASPGPAPDTVPPHPQGGF